MWPSIRRAVSVRLTADHAISQLCDQSTEAQTGRKIFRRGLFTFGLIVCALLLIARSIAVPLVNLSKAVGTSPGEFVPIIPVLHRKDGIGDLNRVMREMSRQIQEHFDQVVKSEMSIRTLNQGLSASESRYRGLRPAEPARSCCATSQYCSLVYGQI
jgi:nitrogen fixation/metabolism regulation signal transduction histidine kinase